MTSQASVYDLTLGEQYEMVAAQALVDRLWPGAQAVKRDKFAAVDCDVMLDGQRIAFLVVKKRRVASTDFEDTAVYYKKVTAARNLNRFYSLPVYCLVVFTDRAGTFDMTAEPDRKEGLAREERDLVAYDHAFYNISRLEWHEALLETIEAAVQTV